MAEQKSTSVTKALEGISFPCDRRQVVEYARTNNAGPMALSALEQIPDRKYANMSEVYVALPPKRRTSRRPMGGNVPSPLPPAESRDQNRDEQRARQPEEPPPEPADYQEEMRDRPRFALGAVETEQEILAPWMWPVQLGMQWLDACQRLGAAVWWWLPSRK